MTKQLLLLILFFSCSFNAISQKYETNFIAENNKMIWQKVFSTDMDFDQLTSLVKESGVLETFEVEDSKIVGQSRLIEADYNGAGFGEMSTPMYISRSFFDAFCIIDFKEGRYRVTLKNIMLSQKYNDGLSKEGEKSTLESFGISNRKNEIKSPFLKTPSIILDYTFTNEFTFEALVNDDW